MPSRPRSRPCRALEIAVAERAIGIRGETLEMVRGKLAIWRALGPGSDDEDMGSPRNRLILSVEADIDALLGRASG